MKILLKNAKVIDPQSSFYDEVVDIFIAKGTIQKIGTGLGVKGAEIIESEHLHVSPGWIDIGAMCWDPGHEYREDISSLKAAAANGGYTTVFVWPNTYPVIDNKAQYQYYTTQNRGAVSLLPMCAASKTAEGKELAEILDLIHCGATLFTDGHIYQGSDNELHRALEYLKPTSARLLYAPNAFKTFPDGQLHESKTSIMMGIQGLPGFSEAADVDRLLSITEYAESTCVVHNISTGDALSQLKSKRVEAIGVAYLNLIYTVERCGTFDTDFKVIPPLRGTKDVTALNKGIEKGKISYISSNHYPVDNDLKDKEFGLAEFGAGGIETVFGALCTDTSLSLTTIVERLTYGPAAAAGISIRSIEEGAPANATIFDPKKEWVYDDKRRRSKCINNPYYNTHLKGRAIGIISGEHAVWNS